jgi:protoporphyrinogen oxidase
VIIGAGPAGLTAAYELAERYGITSTILEADDVVGGISRTVERDGWRFDIGGHRFFTKVQEVQAFWHEILPDEDFMLRPRMSRIFYKGKYYDYPLRRRRSGPSAVGRSAAPCRSSGAVHPPRTSHPRGYVATNYG